MASATNKNIYTFYSGPEYYQELAAQIHATQPGDTICLCSLWLKPEEAPIALIMQELGAAARRGVRTTLLIDAYTFLIKDGIVPGPAYFHGAKFRDSLSPTFAGRLAALEAFAAAGGKYRIINQPKQSLSYPFKGRSHIKFSVINNSIFIGGSNLAESTNIDVMVNWQDSATAAWLREFTADLLAGGSVIATLRAKDTIVPIDNDTQLLLDVGTVDHSLILDTAFELIDEAREKLLITYQYFPHGPTAEHLKKAVHRGVTLRAYYNHHGVHSKPLNILYGTAAWRARRNGPPEFSTHRLSRHVGYLHAKVIASDRAGLLSSHNYMITGVKYGTAEIGIYSTDPAFVKGLTEAIDEQLASFELSTT